MMVPFSFFSDSGMFFVCGGVGGFVQFRNLRYCLWWKLETGEPADAGGVEVLDMRNRTHRVAAVVAASALVSCVAACGVDYEVKGDIDRSTLKEMEKMRDEFYEAKTKGGEEVGAKESRQLIKDTGVLCPESSELDHLGSATVEGTWKVLETKSVQEKGKDRYTMSLTMERDYPRSGKQDVFDARLNFYNSEETGEFCLYSAVDTWMRSPYGGEVTYI